MRSLLFFFGIFALVGCITLLLALLFGYQTVSKISSWEKAPATLVSFGAGNSFPVIEFVYLGEKKSFESSYSNSGMETGQAMTVHFPPGQPDQAEIKNFFNLWFLPLMFSGFTLAFGGVGFYGLRKQLKKMGAKRELFDNQQGKRLSLDITEIAHDYSFKVNGRSPYVITCQWQNPLTREIHEFKSDYLWYHPGTVMGERKQMDVYIDENNPKRYYMDITFLPKKA